MPTRLYLNNDTVLTGLPTPASWTFTANIASPTTYHGSRSNGTAFATITGATGTTTPVHRAMARWIYGPLNGQTIAGNATCQMKCSENNAGANATLGIAIKIIQPDGSDRGVLLSQTAEDTTTATPPEMATSLTNRSVLTTAAVANLVLTSQAATAGDYLVIEMGFRSQTGTSRTISLQIGAGNTTPNDLAVDQTTTANNNPWVEFDTTLQWLTSNTVAGSMTPSAALANQGQLPKAASNLPSSTLAKSDSILGAGSQTTAGTVANQGQIPKTASLTPTRLSSIKTAFKNLIGTLTAAAEIITDTGGETFQLGLAGAMTCAAAILNFTSKALGGTRTDSGNTTKNAYILTSGLPVVNGAIAKADSIPLSGQQAAANGAILNQAQLPKSGLLLPTAVISLATLRTIVTAALLEMVATIVKTAQPAKGGSLGPSSSLANFTSTMLNGAGLMVGNVTKFVQIILAGAQSLVGDITAFRVVLLVLTGTLTMTGSVLSFVQKLVSGLVINAGALLKSISTTQSGTNTPTSAVAKLGSITVSGVGNTTAQVLKQGQLVISSTELPTASITQRDTTKGLTGQLTGNSSLIKASNVVLSGVLTTAGALRNLVRIVVTGVQSLSGLFFLGGGELFFLVVSASLTARGSISNYSYRIQRLIKRVATSSSRVINIFASKKR